MIFDNSKVYDILKFFAQVVLPALATLVSVVMSLWDLAPAETITAIVGTISAVDVFLGALLGISSNQYKKIMEEENESI